MVGGKAIAEGFLRGLGKDDGRRSGSLVIERYKGVCVCLRPR